MITLFIKNKFAVSLIYLLVFSILLMSCETVSNQRISPQTIRNNQTQISNATHLVLKDGTFISLKDMQVFYFEKYKDNANVLVVKNNVGIPYRDTVKNVTYLKYSERLYPLDSIKELYVEKREFDAGGTILVIIGAIAVAALLFVAFVAISLAAHPIRSCPYIYSFDGTNYVLDAEPLGGAVCEGLERTDVSRLENLVNSDGQFKIIVKNVNDEQQRIDQLKFINIKHSAGEYIAPDFNKKFYKYSSSVKPLSVVNEEGKDLTKFLLDKDNVKWQNDLPADTLQRSFNSKETITLKFPKPKNAKNAMLLINGGASYFGSNMIKELLDLRGNKVDEWYKSVYPGSEEQMKMFEAMHRDEAYYMDIKIAEGNKLRNTGIMRSNGPIVDEDVLYPVSLENHNSDFVEIVLTPQRYFWKFDQINIIYDYEEVVPSDIETLNIAYAKDNNGVDVKDKLSAIDKDYYRMPNIGDRTDIYINTPVNYSKETNDIFVATTGWYEINLAKNKNPDFTSLDNMFNTEGGLYKFALETYIKNFKSISQLYNHHTVNEN